MLNSLSGKYYGQYIRNLQYLAAEVFKVKIGISPAIRTAIFKFCDNATHNFRYGQVLERRRNRTKRFFCKQRFFSIQPQSCLTFLMN